ncbi:MAG TPA: cytochrome c3 family protein [Thermoanaerobaculia bacterium]|nr:cytochrome c3 family protein [Thermoanaerobaculia bacterium]
MQVFHRSANSIAKLSIVVVAALVAFSGWLGLELFRSSYITRQGEIHEQPVPFSHEHHVAGLGLDCRYCHTSVETSGFAGLPPSATCMNCHRQIWTNADLLEPVRASYANNVPLRWTRVHKLPEYVYFNHSVHVAKGMGCVTCHGQVDQMPLMYQESPLTMEWCIACHRDPAQNVRPRSEVFNMKWQPPADPRVAAVKRVEWARAVNLRSLTSCSTCHR